MGFAPDGAKTGGGAAIVQADGADRAQILWEQRCAVKE